MTDVSRYQYERAAVVCPREPSSVSDIRFRSVRTEVYLRNGLTELCLAEAKKQTECDSRNSEFSKNRNGIGRNCRFSVNENVKYDPKLSKIPKHFAGKIRSNFRFGVNISSYEKLFLRFCKFLNILFGLSYNMQKISY